MQEKETFTDTWHRIQQEGEGYYLLHYTDGSELPDKKAKKLFNKASDAIREFLNYIKINMEKEK